MRAFSTVSCRIGLMIIMFLTAPLMVLAQDDTDSTYIKLITQFLESRDSMALVASQQFLEKTTQKNDPLLMAEGYRLYGLALRQAEQSMSAIPVFLRERKLRTELKQPKELAEVNLNLGASYAMVFERQTAEDYLDQALEQFNQLKDTTGIAKTLNRLAALRIDFIHPDGRLEGYRLAGESLNLSERIKDFDLQVNNLLLMAAYLRDEGRFNEAIQLLLDAETRVVRAKETFHLALVHINIGHVYRLSKQYDESIKYYRKGLIEAQNSKTRVYIWLAGHGLGVTYNEMDQIDSSYRYHSVGFEARVMLLDEMRAWQKAMFQEELMRAEYEQDLEYKEERWRLRLWILISGVLVFTVFALIFVNQNRVLRQRNQVLAKSNETIRQQSKQLSLMNGMKDKFYSIVAHDLRSPFSGMLGISEVLEQELTELPRPDLRKLARGLHDSIRRVYDMLENLLDWSRIQQGQMKPSTKDLWLDELMEENLFYLRESMKNKSIAFSTKIESRIRITSDPVMLGSVVRNLVSNALKFTPAGGSVQVSARAPAENQIEISVQDTGIGMPAPMLEQFKLTGTMSSRKGTGGEGSAGIGLTITREFVHKLGGSLQVDSEPNKGTRFTIRMPARFTPS